MSAIISLTTLDGLGSTVNASDVVAVEAAGSLSVVVLSNGKTILNNATQAAMLVSLLAGVTQQTTFQLLKSAGNPDVSVVINVAAITGTETIRKIGGTFERLTLEGGKQYDVTSTPAAIATVQTNFETASGGMDDLSYTKDASDAKYALDTIILTAGSGLAGGGTLEAARRFDIGATSGLLSNANDVAINWITPAVSGQFVRWDGTGFVTSAT
jgi:uncharacterized protein YlzI (FlbEa/FlbD family)